MSIGQFAQVDTKAESQPVVMKQSCGLDSVEGFTVVSSDLWGQRDVSQPPTHDYLAVRRLEASTTPLHSLYQYR